MAHLIKKSAKLFLPVASRHLRTYNAIW